MQREREVSGVEEEEEEDLEERDKGGFIFKVRWHPRAGKGHWNKS